MPKISATGFTGTWERHALDTGPSAFLPPSCSAGCAEHFLWSWRWCWSMAGLALRIRASLPCDAGREDDLSSCNFFLNK